MGLVSTVAGLASNTENFGATLGKDLVNNAAKFVGIDPPFTDNVKKDLYYNSSKLNDEKYFSNKFKDLRGTADAYRSKSNIYNVNEKGKSSFKVRYDMDAGDFYWKEDIYTGVNAEPFKPKIQRIILKLFQPYLQFFVGQLITAALNTKKEFEKDPKGAASKAGSTGMSLLTMISKKVPLPAYKFLRNILISDYSSNPNKLYNNSIKSTLTDPITAMTNMFIDGLFLHTYIIPFLDTQGNNGKIIRNTKPLFRSAGAGSFKNIMTSFGNEGKQVELLIKETSIGNIPSTPIFKLQLPFEQQTITTNFYLINKNSLYLVRNYRFLQSFYAGTLVVQLPFGMIQCPNVFYVEIPGKRLMIWAQVGITIAEVGSKFRADQYAFKKIHELTKGDLYLCTPATLKTAYKKVLWPEAWHITVTISDFTPSTFNMRQHYLEHGSILDTLQLNTKNSITNISNLGKK